MDHPPPPPPPAAHAGSAHRLWSPPDPVATHRVKGKGKGKGKGKAVVVKPPSQGAMPKISTPTELLQMLEKVPTEVREEDDVPLPLDSVVKFEVVATTPNYHVPWQMLPQEEFSGSGFVIEGRRILTNAHVVENHSIVRIRRHNGADSFPAKVLCIAHECDLALVTCEEDAFWDGIPALRFASLPRLYEDIMVVGYPIGGDNISVTRGIVSRIDMLPYVTRAVDNATELLVVQIDAAINPGNSGGPACNMEGTVVGVAFAGLNNAQSIGYIIPVPVIRNFLLQYEKFGRFRGVCELGIDVQDMTNRSLRKRFQMAQRTGVLVADVEPLGSAAGHVQKRDVLLSIDGVPVHNDGTLLYRDGRAKMRLSYTSQITAHFVGDVVRLGLLRDGKELTVEVTLGPVPRLVPCFHGDDAYPSYFIVGGLVFTPLSIPLINQVVEDLEDVGTAMSAVQAALRTPKKTPDQQFVVLLRSLIADVNYGYDAEGMSPLKKVNGEEVTSLRDLIRKVKGNTKEFLEFELSDDALVVLEAEECKKSEAAILKQHNISAPVSEDLLEFYKSL